LPSGSGVELSLGVRREGVESRTHGCWEGEGVKEEKEERSQGVAVAVGSSVERERGPIDSLLGFAAVPGAADDKLLFGKLVWQ